LNFPETDNFIVMLWRSSGMSAKATCRYPQSSESSFTLFCF